MINRDRVDRIAASDNRTKRGPSCGCNEQELKLGFIKPKTHSCLFIFSLSFREKNEVGNLEINDRNGNQMSVSRVPHDDPVSGRLSDKAVRKSRNFVRTNPGDGDSFLVNRHCVYRGRSNYYTNEQKSAAKYAITPFNYRFLLGCRNFFDLVFEKNFPSVCAIERTTERITR